MSFIDLTTKVSIQVFIIILERIQVSVGGGGRGDNPLCWGANLRYGCFLTKTCVKTKELDSGGKGVQKFLYVDPPLLPEWKQPNEIDWVPPPSPPPNQPWPTTTPPPTESENRVREPMYIPLPYSTRQPWSLFSSPMGFHALVQLVYPFASQNVP